MAMIKCAECGKDISDKADKCPNCGCPVSYSIENTEDVKSEERELSTIEPVTNNEKDRKGKEKKKDSALSAFAAILGLVSFTTYLGGLLGIIDLIKNRRDGKRHLGSYFAIVMCILWIIIGGSNGGSDDGKNSSTNNNVTTEIQTTEVATESTAQNTTENKAKKKAKHKETEKEYRKSCKEYKFKDVLRNPDKYVGKRVKITIKISSIHEESILNATKYYFGNSENEYGYYGDKYAIFDERQKQDLKLLSDDVITVYGEIAEPEYTSSLILSSEEVFAIKMKYVDLVAE